MAENFSWLFASRNDEKDVRAIEEGKPVRRELAAGLEHAYRIVMDADYGRALSNPASGRISTANDLNNPS